MTSLEEATVDLPLVCVQNTVAHTGVSSLSPALRGAWGYLVPSALTVSVVAVPVMSLPTLYMEPLAKAEPEREKRHCFLRAPFRFLGFWPPYSKSFLLKRFLKRFLKLQNPKARCLLETPKAVPPENQRGPALVHRTLVLQDLRFAESFG